MTKSNGGSRSSKNSDQPQPLQGASSQEPLQRGTKHVRQMQWTDSKGNAGMYTGQVNAQFVPYGVGTMDYDGSRKAKEGEWKNRKYRRSNGTGTSTTENSNCGSL